MGRRRELLEMIGDGLMGLLLRADDIPAKTESQQMAKSILQLREQGRAGEVTEEMMEQADPRTMAAYTPLDMSLDARMERASLLGFKPEERSFHGAVDDPERHYFDSDITPVYTSDNAAVSNTYTQGEDGSMFDLLVKQGASDDISDQILNKRQKDLDIDAQGQSYSAISPKVRDRVTGETVQDFFDDIDRERDRYQHMFDGEVEYGPVVSTDTIANAMRDEDVLHARIRNVLDRGPYSPRAWPLGGMDAFKTEEDFKAADKSIRAWERSMQDQARVPSTDQITFDKGGRLRSRFARFDPQFAHLKNLSAGAVPAGLIPYIMQYLEDVEREQAN